MKSTSLLCLLTLVCIACDDPGEEPDNLVTRLPEPARPGTRPPKPEQDGNASRANLKRIGLALHNFHDVTGAFPTSASQDGQGKPLLSWRVHLLPFLDQQGLFAEFHLNEPWDSPHNRQLIARMPSVYRSTSKLEAGKTRYLGLAGPKGIFTASAPAHAIEDIVDGTSNTAMVLEVADAEALTWTRPGDFEPDFADVRRRVGSQFQFVMADGRACEMSAKIGDDTRIALFTIGGGEAFGGSEQVIVCR